MFYLPVGRDGRRETVDACPPVALAKAGWTGNGGRNAEAKKAKGEGKSRETGDGITS